MKNKNLPLIVGISIPFVFLLIFAGFVYIPRTLISPEYDFVYSLRDYEYNRVYQNKYRVTDGEIEMIKAEIINPNIEYAFVSESPELYLYDVDDEISRLITFEEAEKLSLYPGPSSPDGYVVEYKYGNDGVFELFGGSNDDRGYYVGNGKSWKKLLGIPTDYYYRNGFELIGWVK